MPSRSQAAYLPNTIREVGKPCERREAFRNGKRQPESTSASNAVSSGNGLMREMRHVVATAEMGGTRCLCRGLAGGKLLLRIDRSRVTRPPRIRL